MVEVLESIKAIVFWLITGIVGGTFLGWMLFHERVSKEERKRFRESERASREKEKAALEEIREVEQAFEDASREERAEAVEKRLKDFL